MGVSVRASAPAVPTTASQAPAVAPRRGPAFSSRVDVPVGYRPTSGTTESARK